MRRPMKIKRWRNRILAAAAAEQEQWAADQYRQKLLDLDRELRIVRDIIARSASTNYRRVEGYRGEYRLMLSFYPYELGLNCIPQDSLRWLAREVSRRVEHEIATSKFMDMANESERAFMEHEAERRRMQWGA